MKHPLLDIFILRCICTEELKGKKVTTWNIAKAFAWEDKPNIFVTDAVENEYYRGKTNSIKRRLDAMEKKKLVEVKIDKDKKKYYELKGEKVLKRYKFPTGMKLCLMYQNSGKWHLQEL